MNKIRIAWLDKLPAFIETKMRRGLVAYENQHNIDVNFKEFSLAIFNENDEVCGVLNAYTAFAEIYVNDIWVDEAYRHQGYGKMLLTELEKRFVDQGYNNINLVTSAFQAPEFYKKCGYQVEFVRENVKNPLLTKTFFVKFFANEVQTQGILKKSMSDKVNKNVVNENVFSLSKLEPLISTLTKSCKISAILCYGSYAEGTQDEMSDIDLLVICKEAIPSKEIRQQIYQQQGGELVVLDKNFANWETAWTPVNDELILRGKKIEIGFNLSAWIETTTHEIIETGKTTLKDFSFRPYTLLGLLENATCLWEDKEFITKMKSTIRPFPAQLKENIISENLAVFQESLSDLENIAQRELGLLAFQFMFFRALDAAIQILFALNEVYYPASKREEMHLLRLSKLPQAMIELIVELLPVLFQRKNESIKNLIAIQTFFNEEIKINEKKI